MSPRLLFLLGVGWLGAATASAQFDLGKLTKALDKAKEITTTAKDAGKVVKGAAGIGPKEEADLGDSVALEVIGKYGGLVRDEALMRRVNLVGRALARYSGRPERNWRFGVLDSDTVNGFSAPDGYVFITRGLYDLAPTDDLLAGVLAHEISHITGRHALAIIERDEAFSGGKSLLTKYSASARQTQSQVSQADAYLGQLGLGVGKIVRTLVETGFDAPTEYAADKSGRALAALTGYAPGGLRAALVELEARNGDPKKTFSTHPPLPERIKRLPDDPAAR
jgi:predicted Zn-dependent protease